jgi:hypothetical protein
MKNCIAECNGPYLYKNDSYKKEKCLHFKVMTFQKWMNNIAKFAVITDCEWILQRILA